MKIILIALPRTGSTSIIEYFKHTNKNFKTFSEPFNKNGREGYYRYNQVIKPKNVFVKHIFNQTPKDINKINNLELFEKFLFDFDKIIFLDRKSIKEQSESLSKAMSTGVWHTKYVYCEECGHNKTIENEMNILRQQKNEIDEIKKRYNFKTYYYEDIFFNRQCMIEFISEIGSEYNENNFNDFLDVSKKYRIDKKISGLI